MKEEIEKMYVQALTDDLPPNVFADQVLRLFSVVGRSEQLVCEYCNDDAKPTCCDSCLEGMVNAM
jgi:hypothetical protein